MQSVTKPKYIYSTSGKLMNYVPSGGSSDVIASHILLDPRLTGPRTLLAGGYKPSVLNSPTLFTPPMSATSPPVERPRTLATTIGYTEIKDYQPDINDVYGLTTSAPLITTDRQPHTPSQNSNVVGAFSTSQRSPFTQ